MDKQHQKHAKLKKSKVGQYHRNEYAIMGTTCDDIQSLALKISTSLSHFNIAYVDTEHKKPDAKPEILLPFDFYHHKESSFKYLGSKVSPDQEQYMLNKLDVVLVNGNHHQAASQILVIDERKDLNKKKEKIKQPITILLNKVGEDKIPEFIKKDFPDVPVFDIAEDDWLVNLYEQWMKNTPIVSGLVLSGGKSTRMGNDKGSIVYHGVKQRDYMHDLMKRYGDENYLSVALDHDMESDPLEKPFIKDKFVGLGVYGALLSAFQQEPESAWLVAACDLPMVDEKVLDYLIEHRNPSKFATAFYNPETDFPDPLLTIWEPRAYPVLLQYLSKGYSCPRKVLINSDIELLKVDDSSFLKNVNTQEEYHEVMSSLTN